MTNKIWLHCCGCEAKVLAWLTDGSEIYPHREDLYKLPFWKCQDCGNYVGCHHKTNKRTSPLGCIPTPELMKARGHIHKILDPIWKSKRMTRGKIYKKLSDALGWKYHTAKIKSIEEARTVFKLVRQIAKES